MDEPEVNLAGAVMQHALKDDGPCYFMMDCGIWWAGILGLDPKFLYEKAAAQGAHRGVPYERIPCSHRPENKTSMYARRWRCPHGRAPIRSVPWLYKIKDKDFPTVLS